MPPKALDVPTKGGILRFRRGNGWATFDPHPDPGPLVQLRVGEERQRFVVLEVHIVAGSSTDPEVTGTTLRSIPLGAIERAINGPGVRDRVEAHVRSPGPTYTPSDFGPARRSFADLLAEIEEHPSRPSRVLTIPKKKPRPDEFYASVAELYTWLAGPGGSRRPAVDIAHDNDVPASTVHRWLREARARGLMAPGQRGAST